MENALSKFKRLWHSPFLFTFCKCILPTIHSFYKTSVVVVAPGLGPVNAACSYIKNLFFFMLYNLMRKTNLHDKHSTAVPVLLSGMVDLSSLPLNKKKKLMSTQSFLERQFLLILKYSLGQCKRKKSRLNVQMSKCSCSFTVH